MSERPAPSPDHEVGPSERFGRPIARVGIVTPAPPGRLGNRVTAERWQRVLEALGYATGIVTGDSYAGEPWDVLVALHAKKSAAAAALYRARYPDRPLIVALTGTDLYVDLDGSPEAQRTVRAATRLVVLQPRALDKLPADLRERARVIYQSARAPADAFVPPEIAEAIEGAWPVCVIGHMREVKDPFRAALASRLLPAASRLRVIHLGRALTPERATTAEREAAANPRYRWFGDVSRAATWGVLSACRLLVMSSRSEGGANVVAEAIVSGLPVVATEVPGNVGMLGQEYLGYYPFGDTEALALKLAHLERTPEARELLRRQVLARQADFTPAQEYRRWGALLGELGMENEPGE